jgi:F-type H+-transporting ATPase subunit delta|tara:strand:+ start:774 stop:1331 length:558 start_codon:yes stop_codon:yes gene_type:complete
LSTKKSFSTETSERYALALYELASENSEIENIEKDVNGMLSLYNSSEDIRMFMQNPTKSIDLQIHMINKISELLEFTKTFKNFLSVLIVKRRIFFIGKIIKNFIKLITKKKGILEASLISSKELSKEEIKKISEELSKSIGSTVNFDYKVDKNLIGGLKVQLGSLMIDSSIKNKLKKYEQLMLES